ncbi:uncharacterized protein LOC130744358 [Lotus japonicus]|uniref:uncharacterized protein LOC130744358 n=1 Tax=Lotus japonicus TaxID=34305 RepID=UPI002587A372|nr:uncharacterized protein LOC130744358 [Lotus japonicus]
MALPQGSLASFRDLSSKFLDHFSARAIEDLFDIRQGERETLKQYMKRYSATSARFEELEPRVCVCAFKGGLPQGKFSCELSRELACSMTEVRARAQDYILEEEMEAHKRKHERAAKVSLARKHIQDEEASHEQRVKEAGRFVKKNKGGLSSSGRKNVGYRRSRRIAETSRRMRPKGRSSKELTKLLLEVGIEDMDREGECRMDPGYVAKDQPKWCEYHNLEGHSTTDCFMLKDQIKQLIKARQPRAARRKEAKETDSSEGKGTVETANTIAGCFEGGDGVSTAARKQVGVTASVQEYPAPFGCQHPDIVVSSADFEGIKAHINNPLAVMVRIKGFNVQRVLLDQGSSADIIYGVAFEQLGLTDKDLKPYTRNLVGFSRKQVQVRGCVELDTVF